jgi:hypothetical protein
MFMKFVTNRGLPVVRRPHSENQCVMALCTADVSLHRQPTAGRAHSRLHLQGRLRTEFAVEMELDQNGRLTAK